MTRETTLEWLGGPNDGVQMAVPASITEITVAYRHPLGWKKFETQEPIVYKIVYPVRRGKIHFYEGKEL